MHLVQSEALARQVILGECCSTHWLHSTWNIQFFLHYKAQLRGRGHAHFPRGEVVVSILKLYFCGIGLYSYCIKLMNTFFFGPTEK